jgi:hypothetical protein
MLKKQKNGRYLFVPEKLDATLYDEHGKVTDLADPERPIKRTRKPRTLKAKAAPSSDNAGRDHGGQAADTTGPSTSWETQYLPDAPEDHGPGDEDQGHREEDLHRDLSSRDEAGPRLDLANRYFQQYTRNREHVLSNERKAKQEFQELVGTLSNECLCPVCSSPPARRMEMVPVAVVSWDNLLEIEVPVMLCSNCLAHYNIHPTQVNCRAMACFPLVVIRLRQE